MSHTLNRMTPDQEAWARRHVLEHHAYRTPAFTKCLDCGATWKTVGDADPKKLMVILEENKSCTCPGCGTKSKVTDTRNLTLKQRKFYSTVEVVKEFQVVRIYEVTSTHKAKENMRACFCEVAQQWILPDGSYELIARLRGSMGIDCWFGDLEIRGKQSFFEKYNIEPDGIYPKMGILPVYKKHGFKGHFHSLTPHNLFTQLGHSTICETLMKRKEFGFLQALCLGSKERKAQVNRYWPSIKICMRHGYYVTPKQVCDYLDHLGNLEVFGEDLNNPHFVCPADFKADKRRYIARSQAQADRKRAEEQRARIVQENIEYVAKKGIFFGIACTDGRIAIKVIESVQEVYEHGKVLHHCVFGSSYHKREHSLLLSATVDGQLAETIEFDLQGMKIAQARELQNQPHAEHKAILALLTKNIPVIKKTKIKAKKHGQATQVAA